MTIDNQMNNLSDIPKLANSWGETVKLFVAHGYSDIEVVGGQRSNDIFVGQKEGQRLFIKKYRERAGSSKSAESRIKAEIACYDNLPKENLLDVVEINSQEKYLVLKNTELDNIAKNEESVGQIIDLYLNKLAKLEPAFLPENNWDDYEQLFDKLKTLEGLGLVSEADKYIEMFRDNKESIETAKKVFSHRDFNLSNLKEDKGRLVIFDFEHSVWDNPMYDLATFFVEINDNAKLKEIFENHVKNHALYSNPLFNLMLARRCIDVMHGLRDNQTVPYFQKNKEVLSDIERNL